VGEGEVGFMYMGGACIVLALPGYSLVFDPADYLTDEDITALRGTVVALFSHALDMLAEKPALHGEQTGVGTIIMAYLHGMKWERVRETLKRVGAPTNAYELGIDPEVIIEALTIAHTIRPGRYTILGKDGLTREAAEKAAKITGVI